MGKMKLLGTFEQARLKAFSDVESLIGTLQNVTAKRPICLDEGIRCLHQLRKSIYEDLNQIQHECLAIYAAEWLVDQNKVPNRTIWFWNPRQTGDDTQPDLRGMCDDVVVASAELTTSEEPKGVIDTRMRDTLQKLAKMDGDKFYFTRTDS